MIFQRHQAPGLDWRSRSRREHWWLLLALPALETARGCWRRAKAVAWVWEVETDSAEQRADASSRLRSRPEVEVGAASQRVECAPEARQVGARKVGRLAEAVIRGRS